MKPRILTAAAALAALAATSPALHAQAVQEWSASSGLLPSENVPEWLRYDLGTCAVGTATLGPTVLTIDTSSPCPDDSLSYSRTEYGGSSQSPSSTWAEARLRVVQSADADPDQGVAMILVAPRNVCGWFLSIDVDEVVLYYWDELLARAPFDAQSAMHTYRIEGDPITGLSTVHIDGQLILMGAVPTTGCSLPTTPRLVSFGNVNARFGGSNTQESGITEWEFVRDNIGAGAEVFCNDGAAVNSQGFVAGIAFTGSRSVAANDLVLETNGLPPSSFGFYLCSRSFSAPNPLLNSQGSLCLGGAIGRFDRSGEIQMASAGGEVSLTVDLTNVPQPTGAVAVVPGDSWHFQYWYRDANPGLTSNLSRALQLVFE